MENPIHGDDETKSRVAVLIVPFPAQGHLNQLLQFSCLVSSYGLPVSYIGSEIHNRQAKIRMNGIGSKYVERINFHNIPIPPFESPAPNPDSQDKFPHQLIPSWYATLSFRQPFEEYLRDMSRKYTRVVVVHDHMMTAVVQDVASVENAESYIFCCVPAFFSVPFELALQGKPLPEYFPKLPSFDGILSEGVMNFVAIHQKHEDIRTGTIYNTCRSIEAPFLDLIENEVISNKKMIWAIGPVVSMIPDISLSDKPETRHECLLWLDKQDPKSVIYVSFGTTTSLSNEQIKELAFGLEESKVKFIWVVREADKGDIFDEQVRRAELPEGFEDRVKGMGLVVRNWAPQLEILSHSSTGGFMSHCGWNSCNESITQGVPIAAWPMHSDQPINSTFIIDVLKIGLIVRDWSKRLELVKALDIKNAAIRLMTTDEGIELRKKAEELADIIRQATQPGGASHLQMDSFLAYITR